MDWKSTPQVDSHWDILSRQMGPSPCSLPGLESFSKLACSIKCTYFDICLSWLYHFTSGRNNKPKITATIKTNKQKHIFFPSNSRSFNHSIFSLTFISVSQFLDFVSILNIMKCYLMVNQSLLFWSQIGEFVNNVEKHFKGREYVYHGHTAKSPAISNLWHRKKY